MQNLKNIFALFKGYAVSVLIPKPVQLLGALGKSRALDLEGEENRMWVTVRAERERKRAAAGGKSRDLVIPYRSRFVIDQ